LNIIGGALGTAKPVRLGLLKFGTKGEAAAFLRSMLHKYDVGDKVGADDTEVLVAALARHPEATEKIGAGVASFSVRSADFGSKCFWVNRVDGSTEKFSYRSCI
jgi:hypothetical protein